MSTPIRPGQIYRYCDPRESIRIRITSYRPGDARADVVDAVTGKRPRQVLVRQLHDSPITAAGQPRRGGYVLDRVMTAPTSEQLHAIVERACRGLSEAEGALLRAELTPRKPLGARQDAPEGQNAPQGAEAAERPPGGHTAPRGAGRVDIRDYLAWLKTEAARAEDAGRRPKAPELGLVSDGMTCAFHSAVIELTRRLDGRDAAWTYMRQIADNHTPDASRA